jgi:crotonobetainyl-CoA:carnitine CoA-transferase CaiB-like acyl-CoA transferase
MADEFKNIKPGALEGITVIDFTWVLAGPHATKLLADMGATIIKIEPFQVGSNERQLPLRREVDGVTQSSYSINVNRGKKSICIDMKNPKGMEIVKALIKKADVIIENYAPGVMNRLGLDYDSVKKIKEDIIYCSISCFGHWGPYCQGAGYDIIAQAAAGWSDQLVDNQGIPSAVGDMTSGTYAALAIVSAVLGRTKHGVGQNIDISIMDCLFSWHENTIPWYTMAQAIGEDLTPPKFGRYFGNYAPYGVYNGRDGRIAVACLTENRWQPMVKVMGQKYSWLLTDERSKTLSARCINAAWLNPVIDEWVGSIDSVAEVERILGDAGVPCMRARTIKELADTDEQVKAREMMPVVEQPLFGPIKMFGSPIKMSESPSCIRGYAPFLGEHNSAVLADLLGYDQQQVKALYDSSVIYHEPAVERLNKT